MTRKIKKVFFVMVLTGVALGLALQPLSVWASGPPVFVTKWSGFSLPASIAVDSAGNVYVADSGNFFIKKFDSNGNFLTQWGGSGSGDGQFLTLTGVAVDSAGNVYATDALNFRVQKFDSSGAFVTKWGSSGSGDGQFMSPTGVAVDSAGNVYVADTKNKRIQKFSSAGAFITEWATSGEPIGLAVDNSGNVYVTNTPSPLIQKFTTTGTLLTQWGSPGSDGGQFSASVAGVTVDNNGNVYIADRSAHRMQMFDENGTFLRMWGFGVNTGAVAYEVCTAATTPCQLGIFGSGDGQFNGPADVAVDSTGNIYVVEESNGRVQKFGQPPLVLTKSVDDDQPALGQRITYTITVDNSGAVTATNAVISDTLPDGLTFIGPVTLEGSSGITGSPPTLASDLTISVGKRITVTFPVTVNSDLPPNAVITNTAAVTSAEMVTPQTGSTLIRVNPVKLTLIKAVSNNLPNPGQRITYTVTVSNSGIVSATNAVISDTLPDGLTFIGPVTLEGSSGITGSPPTLASGLTISAGTSITLTFPVTVNTNQDHGTIIINTAAVTSAEVTKPQSDSELIVLFDTISPTFPISDLLTGLPLITPTLDVILDTTQPLFEWYPAWDNGQVLSYVLTLSSTLDSINLLAASDSITTTQTSFTPTVGLPNGVYTWTVRAQDAAGNKSQIIQSQNFTIQVDNKNIYLPIVLKADQN